MLGTLNGALEVRGIKLAPEAISASATGVNELVNGLVRLTEIRIHYRLSIPAGSRDSVDRALSRHQERCPTATSLAAAVAISWSADITEHHPG
jgi:uncharacterized OsmC-like protein